MQQDNVCVWEQFLLDTWICYELGTVENWYDPLSHVSGMVTPDNLTIWYSDCL